MTSNITRFVILEHAHAGKNHWDLMLEEAEKLTTWQVPCHPDDWFGKSIECQKIFDHRCIYLEYEGPLSNNRGCVKRVVAGKYRILKKNKNYWLLSLSSDMLKGTLKLTNVKNDIWYLVYQGEHT